MELDDIRGSLTQLDLEEYDFLKTNDMDSNVKGALVILQWWKIKLILSMLHLSTSLFLVRF